MCVKDYNENHTNTVRLICTLSIVLKNIHLLKNMSEFTNI